MSEVDWIPALSVLAAGLVIGGLVLWRSVLRGAPTAAAKDAPEGEIERRDLLAKRDALLAQLGELDGAASRRTPEQLALERHALEHEAARVLRDLDQRMRVSAPAKHGKKKQGAPANAKATPVESIGRAGAADAVADAAGAAETTAGADSAETLDTAEAAAPERRAPSALAGFLWGVGSVAAIGLLFFFVSQAAKERAPGGSATGNIPMAGGPAAGGGTAAGQPEDVELAQARVAVERNPDDVELRLDLVRLLLFRQDMMAVFQETQAVLQRSPGNARALSYQALVRLAMGQTAQAESMLQEVIRKEPQLPDAYLHLMFVYVRTGRVAEAEKVMLQAAKLFPDRAQQLRSVFAQMRATASDQPQAADAGSASEDPHANLPVAGAGQPAAGPQSAGQRTGGQPAGMPAAGAAPASGSEKKVAGFLELDPSLKGRSFPGAIVFVTLRDGSFGAGPPLAAKRLALAPFPMPFEIGSSDSMSGEPLPDDLLIEARVDEDGNPMTRVPSDPYGRERVPAGSTGVRVVLKPKVQ